MNDYISTTFEGSFEEAIIKTTEELNKEGFGVLTEIDVKETLKKKLDVDFKKYKIQGGCNPGFFRPVTNFKPLTKVRSI